MITLIHEETVVTKDQKVKLLIVVTLDNGDEVEAECILHPGDLAEIIRASKWCSKSKQAN